jgi:demethylmenaquinone methyltransferase/2-methoxy-6-polyprenyl-1,4-benzoquinol methylase
VAADFSPGMIEVGRRRQAGMPNIVFVEADATKLPFGDEEFDAVTISFGLRNVNEPKLALAEFFRVAKPGGRLVICEFSHPPAPSCARVPRVPALRDAAARAASSSNDTAYEYLNESINAWPDQRTLAGWIRDAGWVDVEWRNLTMGVVALHRARKPLA